jgi:S1-C subfamily serine protease
MSDTASRSTVQDVSNALSQIVTGVAAHVVGVHSHRSRSSGFAWRPSLIVTADEALAEDGEIVVELAGGETVPAILVGRDPTTDIALLRVERADLQPATLEGAPVPAGALAVVVGAQDGGPVAALGMVARAGAAWRSLRGGEIDARIDLDIALRRNAEGGLALNAAGGAIGMAVFGPRRRVLVIPAATINRVAAKLETHGRIARGYLGLGLQTVRLDSGDGGVMVMSVDADGPGFKAGVLQGDIVTGWDGRPVGNMRSLLRALGPDSVGSTVALSVTRAGAPIEVRLVIGERPPA